MTNNDIQLQQQYTQSDAAATAATANDKQSVVMCAADLQLQQQ